MTAQQWVSLLKAGGRVPLAFPLQCYAWIVGLLIRILCVGYYFAERGAIGARTVGSVLHQRSLLDSGTAGGGAVTYCYRSLSCDGHSLVLCGCLCLLVARNIGLVRVHVCRAKRCVLRTDGHQPFSFLDPGSLYALAVPDFNFAKGVLSALNRSVLAQPA
jgi:hypothetical protein